MKTLSLVFLVLSLVGCAAAPQAPVSTWIDDGVAYATDLSGTCTLTVTYAPPAGHFVYYFPRIDGAVVGGTEASAPGGTAYTYADAIVPENVISLELTDGTHRLNALSVSATCREETMR